MSERKWKAAAIALGGSLIVIVMMGQAAPVTPKAYLGMSVVTSIGPIQYHTIYRMRADGVVEAKAVYHSTDPVTWCASNDPEIFAIDTPWHVLSEQRCRP